MNTEFGLKKKNTIPPWVVLASTGTALTVFGVVLILWEKTIQRRKKLTTNVNVNTNESMSMITSPCFFERRWNATTPEGFRVVVIDDFLTENESIASVHLANMLFMKQSNIRRTVQMNIRRPLEKRIIHRASNIIENIGDAKTMEKSAQWVRLGATAFKIIGNTRCCIVVCCDDFVDEIMIQPCGLRLPGRRSRCFWFYWTPNHATSAMIRGIKIKNSSSNCSHAIIGLLSR